MQASFFPSAAWIGACAVRALAGEENAVVCGVTSAGIFLKTGGQAVVFISPAPWRGPWTINVPPFSAKIPGIRNGQNVTIDPNSMRWEDCPSLRIELDQAQTWRCPPLPISPDNPNAIRDRFQAVVSGILVAPPDTPSLPLLRFLRGIGGWPTPDEPSGFTVAVQQLLTGLLQGRLEAVSANLPHIIGFGRGLTPSGDDLLIGLLFCLARYPLIPQAPLAKPLIDLICDHVWMDRTTRISRELIRAAAQGEVDERLLLGFDGLILGSKPVEAIIPLLRAWGSSSGCDALAGVGLYLVLAGVLENPILIENEAAR